MVSWNANWNLCFCQETTKKENFRNRDFNQFWKFRAEEAAAKQKKLSSALHCVQNVMLFEFLFPWLMLSREMLKEMTNKTSYSTQGRLGAGICIMLWFHSKQALCTQKTRLSQLFTLLMQAKECKLCKVSFSCYLLCTWGQGRTAPVYEYSTHFCNLSVIQMNRCNHNNMNNLMRMNFCTAAAKLNEWSFREMENYGKVSLQPHKDPKVLLKLGWSWKLLQRERNGMMKWMGVAEKQWNRVNLSGCSRQMRY